MAKINPRVGFERQRENVCQLLRDRSNDLTSGTTIKDFAEMGAHQGGGDVFTAEYVKRAFGSPEKGGQSALLTEEYVDNVRAASFVLLEKRLRKLKLTAPLLHAKVTAIHPREGGAHRDYEWHTKLATRFEDRARELDAGGAAALVEVGDNPGELSWRRNKASGDVPDAEFERTSRKQAELLERRDYASARARELRKDLYLCDLGIDLLALLCRDDDLFVEFARVRTVLEDEKMEEQNARIASEYEESKASPGTSEKEAAQTVGDRWGISASRVRQIAEGQRLARGEEKRKPGRPRKEAG